MTPKQERFAQEYALGEHYGHGTKCYRAAYNAENMSDIACAVEAHKLLANPKVSLKIDELMAERKDAMMDATGITLERQTRELAINGTLARESGQYGAAIQAEMGIAKLHGLLTEDRKNARDPLTEAMANVRKANKAEKRLH